MPNPALENRFFRTVPRSDVLGADVLGVDLSCPIGPALFEAINTAFLHHKVLAFPDQDLDTDAQVAFAERFGALQVHVLSQYHATARPDVLMVTNLDTEGQPTGEHPDPGACIWHTDGSWQARPVLATSLFAISIPPAGGDTLFADLVAAYQVLDAEERARYDDLVVVHDLDYSRGLSGARDQMSDEQRREAPPVEHPLVRRHAETGLRGFYLGEHASHVEGMPLEEGRGLVSRLNGWITSERFVYRHAWRERELVVWDNRAVLHKATPFDAARDTRVLRRTTTIGLVPPTPPREWPDS